MDEKAHIDRIVTAIRQRMRARWPKLQILQDLGKQVPMDLLFICYKAAALMERDYGRRMD